MIKIAIVGGGPGGLLTAYLMEKKFNHNCQITLFEASSRIGGKIATEYFKAAPVMHEAGVAELYGYKKIGPDPLHDLMVELGLETVPMKGQTLVLEDKVLHNRSEIQHLCGQNTVHEIETFRNTLREKISLDFWYDNFYYDKNEHPWSKISFQELLDQIPDRLARKFIKVAVHSDLATEPHLTNGLYGAENCLMDVPGYIELYTLKEGIEQFPQTLKNHLKDTKILLSAPVSRIEKEANGYYQVYYQQNEIAQQQDFEVVFICLPVNWLGSIEWRDEKLRQAMNKHIAYYDRPGHYLRVTLLFQSNFWQSFTHDSWFISDAFGGVCIYNESARYDTKRYGVLSFLLAGNEAERMGNFKDTQLIEKVLAALPTELVSLAKQQFIEGKVDRWLGTVNALPGGHPVRSTRESHLLAPNDYPELFLVGDYLFDTTLNGVFDSADFATNLFRNWLVKRELNELGNTSVAQPNEATHLEKTPPAKSAKLIKVLPRTSVLDHFSGDVIHDLIKIVWTSGPDYRLLLTGTFDGINLATMHDLGINAFGVEPDSQLHQSTPPNLQSYNLRADLNQLPFADNSFDFVFDTFLSYIPEHQLNQVIKELYRVTKRGFIFAGISSDINPLWLKQKEQLQNVKTLMSLWEWSEIITPVGYQLLSLNAQTLHALWQAMLHQAKKNPRWFSHKECLNYCFYGKD